jgi:hypothetical protein
LHQHMYEVIFGVLTLFCCFEVILFFMDW